VNPYQKSRFLGRHSISCSDSQRLPSEEYLCTDLEYLKASSG
jgi:hypothetical protein